jgi:hypothetical protein
MDVILLNSGPKEASITTYRTLGAYKIAHSVRNAGYSCQVIDHVMFQSEEQLRTSILKFITSGTTVIGVSTTFMRDPDVSPGATLPVHIINVLNEISEQFPQIKLIFGGYGIYLITKAPGPAFVKRPYATIHQYGEDIFVDVLNFLKGRAVEPQWTIAEVNSRLGFSGIVKHYTQPLETRYNIETDNFKFTKQDVIMPSETLPLEISRGCIFKCKFCNHLLLGRGKLDYLRDFELIREELIHNYENWGTTNYYVICDTFNDTEYKMQAWHKMVTSLPFKINWTSYLRADLLDRFPDVPYMLKETGLYSCYHGIESLGEEASRVIGKGWSGKRARDYLPELYHNIWGKEVFQTLSFIVGLPGDTRHKLINTANWFNDNDMYNMSWHPLGLSKSNFKHASEFERNATQYGYSFLSETNWKNDIFTYKIAAEFTRTLLGPMNAPHSARHGSWKIMQLRQLGYTTNDFLKENNHLWNKDDQHQRTTQFINQYISSLMAL